MTHRFGPSDLATETDDGAGDAAEPDDEPVEVAGGAAWFLWLLVLLLLYYCYS